MGAEIYLASGLGGCRSVQEPGGEKPKLEVQRYVRTCRPRLTSLLDAPLTDILTEPEVSLLGRNLTTPLSPHLYCWSYYRRLRRCLGCCSSAFRGDQRWARAGPLLEGGSKFRTCLPLSVAPLRRSGLSGLGSCYGRRLCQGR